MDFQALLQGIFPAQGLNPRLIMSPALQAGFLPLAPPGKPEHTGKDPNRPQLNGRKRSLWLYWKWEMFPAVHTAARETPGKASFHEALFGSLVRGS